MYSIWIWRVPYKEKFIVLQDSVEADGSIINYTTRIMGSDFIRLLQDKLYRNGLYNLGRQPDDHPSLIETWI